MSNSFVYTYDRLNRLTSGVTTDSAYAERNITYDQAGNIQTLSRVYGGNLTDSLVYHYTKNAALTNQVQTIQDLSNDPGTTGFAAGTGTYHYDPNGNMNTFSSTNPSAKTYSTTYNLLNLPDLVHSTVSSVYEYDASGEKLNRIIDTNETDYISGIQYDNNHISFIQTEEGRVFPYSTDTSNYYQYFLADHLGNTRVAFDTPHNTLKVDQQDDYLPFGMEISQGSVANPKNEYLYNKKELQEDSQLYDYGARFYDPVVGRWNTVDPLAEISRRWSPYDYVENDPIRNTDPDGMEVSYNGDNVTYTGEDATNFAIGLKIAGETTKAGKEKVRKDAISAAEKKKKEAEKKNWQYSVPIWGDDLRAQNDWAAGNYWSWAGDQASAVTTGIFLLEAGAEDAAVSAYKSIAGLFARDASIDLTATLSKMEFKELQALTKMYSKEMDTFFYSEGKTVPSKAALQTYEELIKRVTTRTGGAYQKVTSKMAEVYAQRLQWINNALKYEK